MRKTYAYDFKIKICKIIVNKESSVGKIAKEYEISRPIISRWIAEYLRYGLKAFSGNGKMRNDKINTHFLEKKISELELENMILKKFEHFVKLKNEVRFNFIKEYAAIFPILQSAKLLNVSRSGYYQ